MTSDSFSQLTTKQFERLIRQVFDIEPVGAHYAILLDVPMSPNSDNDLWCERRKIGHEWLAMLQQLSDGKGDARIVYYQSPIGHNANLPARCFTWKGNPVDANFEVVEEQGEALSFENLWTRVDAVFALTEHSATAPLKSAVKNADFKAVSMPGFSREMLPALNIDIEKVHDQVMCVKRRLDKAEALEIIFTANGERRLFVDLRFREAHASSGLLRDDWRAGNLPSGEAFIVPYEGERSEPSRTAGELPMQFGSEIVVFKVSGNRAVEILTSGKFSIEQRQKLADEPAYGNISEIGFGVLRGFGIMPVGKVLLDEKLGLHIAFGRSDHFGGHTSPSDFRDQNNVEHTDHVYISDLQPRIQIKEVRLILPGGGTSILMHGGSYVWE